MDDLIDQLAAARRQNNENWMALLRLAMKAAPDEARTILADINAADKEISILIGRLAGE